MSCRPQPRLFLPLVLLACSGIADLGQAGVAASAPPKKDHGPQAVQPRHGDQSITPKSTKWRSKKVFQDQADQQVVSPQNKQSLDRAMAHRGRPKQTKKRLRPLASVHQDGDLSYHGLLEQPRRYDPSPARRKGGIPNPQAGDLRDDHFQELDRNRDGVIDPFERVSGRLDIDRDLTNRQ